MRFAVLVSAFSQLLDLLLPSQCALCQRLPSVICLDCLRHFEGASRRVERGELGGVSLFDFDERSAKLMTEFKEKGQFAIANSLIDHLLAESAQTATLSSAAAQVALLSTEAELLVAMPSSAKSFTKRGFVPAEVIANRLAKHLGLRMASKALWLTRRASDQAGLDQEARATNLVGAMAASTALKGKRVLLVDDIVTTGSSLVEAARAVTAVGALVVGFVTLAETILKIALPEAKRV